MLTDNVLDLIGNTPLIQLKTEHVSALLGHEPGLHQIQGIGDGFIPPILDVAQVDEVIEVTDEDAIETTRQLGRNNGLLVGISSGANVWAARQLANRIHGNITTVLPDRAERYFSTSLMYDLGSPAATAAGSGKG